MTDGLDQALVNTALTLLDLDGGLTVYRGKVPDPTPDVRAHPWVLVHSAVSRPAGSPDGALNGCSSTWVAQWWCHCVGATEGAALALAQRVRTQLLDQRPTVPGLVCNAIREEDSLPPVSDETQGVPVFDVMRLYRLQAQS